MRIKEEKCTGCEICIPYCPVFAIKVSDRGIIIDEELCVECGTCLRSSNCPVDAIENSLDIDEWPRSIRKLFSDPSTTHKVTQVMGRGTEEVKTNDITGRVKRGERAFCVEMGRPGIGADFRDIEIVAKALATLEVEFEEKNPITSLMKNPRTGELVEDVMGERVLSLILEFKMEPDKIGKLMETLNDVSKKINTVFSVGCMCRIEPDGRIPAIDEIEREGYKVSPWLKMNMGLGKPLVKE